MRQYRARLLAFAALLVFGGTAQAAPVLWDSVLGGNDHYYEVVTFSGTWEQALTHTGTQPLPDPTYGTGYLASIASAEEQAFVLALSGFGDNLSWFGATDADAYSVEGTWVWVGLDGATTPFWQGVAAGTPIDGAYTHWNGGEPNDTGGEDYGDIYDNGNWNDWTAAGVCDSYIIEFETVSDGDLNSRQSGSWNLTTTWEGTVPGGRPTATSRVAVDDADDVFIPGGTTGRAGILTVEDTGSLDVLGTLDTGTVDLTSTGSLSIGATGIVTGRHLILGSAPTLAAGATIDVDRLSVNTAFSPNLAAVTVTAPATNVGPGGTLTVNRPLSADTITVDGGSLAVTGSGSYAADNFLLSDTDVTVPIGGAAAVTGEGGTVNLDGAMTFSGKLTATGGTLNVNTPIDQAVQVAVDGGTMVINRPTATTGGFTPNVFEHRGFNFTLGDAGLDLDNNGGMLLETPDNVVLLTDGPGGRGLDFNNDGDWINSGAINLNDNYMNLFIGRLVVPAGEGGTWTFNDDNPDDTGGIWIDLDQDGVFESSQAGVGDDRGEQLTWDGGTQTRTLTAGETYMFAVTHREGAGGSTAHVLYQSPSMSSQVTLKPSAPAQAGLWFGNVDSATNVANGTLAVNAPGSLTTGTLAVANGGTVDAGGLIVADLITIAAGGTYNANAIGSLGTAATVVNLSGRLNVTADGAAADRTISPSLGGFINMSSQTRANFPAVLLATGAGLGGDLTGAVYSGTGQNVMLSEGATLIATAGPLPSRTEAGGATLYQGITDVDSSAAYNFGDNNIDAIFKGGAIGGWSSNGNFEATVNDVSHNDAGIELLMTRDVAVNGATKLNTANVTRGTEFIGTGVLRMNSFPGGSSNLITRTGFYDPDDPNVPNTTGLGIVQLENDSAVYYGDTLVVTKGAVDTRSERPLHFNATLVIGEHATLAAMDDPNNSARADHLRQGNIVIDAGGMLVLNNEDRMSAGAGWTIDPDAFVFLRENSRVNNYDSRHATSGFGDVNLIIQADQFEDGLFLGDGRRLTHHWDGGTGTHATNTVIKKSELPGWDPTGSFVIFSSSGGTHNSNNIGGDLDVNSKVELAGVDLYINDAVDSPDLRITLPKNENDWTRRTVNNDGRVNLDQVGIEADDLIVRNGYLRFGSNEEPDNRDRDFRPVLTGKIEAWDNAELEIYGARGEGEDNVPATDSAKLRYQFENDTLTPGGLFLDQGSMFRPFYRSMESASTGQGDDQNNEELQWHSMTTPHVVEQTMIVRGTGAREGGRTFSGLPMTVIRFDEDGDDVNNDNHVLFPNLVLEEGAHVGIQRANVDREELRLGVTLRGNATMERENEEWSFEDVNVDVPGSEYTLKVNRDGNGGQIDVYGTIGAGVTLMPEDTTLDFNWGADMEDGAFAANLGKLTPGAPGSAGFLRVWTGSDGNNPLTGGTLLVGGNEDVEIRVNEVGFGENQIVNNLGATVMVLDDGTDTRDAVIRTQRGIDLDVPGKVVYANVVLDEAAYAYMESANDVPDYNVLKLDLGTGGRLQLDDNMALEMETVSGFGRIHNSNQPISVQTALSPAGGGEIHIDVGGGLELFNNLDYNLELGLGGNSGVNVQNQLDLGTWALDVSSIGRPTLAGDQITVFKYGSLLDDTDVEPTSIDTSSLVGWGGAADVVHDPNTNRIYLTGISSPVVTSVASTAWKTAGTWGPAIVPESSTIATVDDSDVVTVAAAGQTAYELNITENGRVIVTGGLTLISNADVGASATLDASAGVLVAPEVSTAGTTTLGAGADVALLDVTGGSATVSGAMVGSMDIAVGTGLVTGGSVGSLSVGSGTASVTGGSVDSLSVGGGTATVSGPVIPDVSVTGGVLNTDSDAGKLTVDGGDVVATGAISISNMDVASGSVTFSGGDLSVASAKISGGTQDLGGNLAVVSRRLKLGAVNYALSGAANFTAANVPGSTDLLTGANLTVNGGTLSIGGAMPEGLKVWLDASKIAAGNGAPIATWADQSGNGNDATQGNTGDQPTYVASSGLNGQPAVHFTQDNDNDGDRMRLGDLSAQFPDGATLVAVFTPEETANKRYNLFGNSGEDDRWCAQDWNESYPTTFRTGRAASENFALWPDTQNSIVVMDSDSSVYRILIDGAEVYNEPASYSNGSGQIWTIGNRSRDNSAGQAFNGDIAEFMLFDNVLSPNDANNVGGYLADKYGLATTYDGGLGTDTIQETTNLTVTANSTLSSAGEKATLGNLAVQPGVTSLELQAAVFSFQNAVVADGVTLAGEMEARGTLDVGTLTIGDGELVLGSGATYNAEVNLSNGPALEADKIVVSELGSIHIDGTLAPKGVGRTDASFYSADTLTIIDKHKDGIFTGFPGPTGVEFAAVDPEPGTTASSHIGQGAFLRDVHYERLFVTVTTAVELDVFVALGGDSDGDGKIWLSDWAALRANFGNSGTGKTWTDANFDPWVDDKVWLSDWAALRAGFGNASYVPAGAAAVP
ncbi:MAG: hypothetical protein HQ567_31275, partial [Candidatus Nealsonbacteria bacterium]|nr:hypothetical protein [Candidatus Nealsonbacteria bacterium]